MEQHDYIGSQPVTVHGVLARPDTLPPEPSAEPCTLRFTLLSWRPHDGPIIRERLHVWGQFASREDYSAAWSSLPPHLRCMSAVVRRADVVASASHESGQRHVELVGATRRIAPDPALLASAWALTAGVDDEPGGVSPPAQFTLDSKLECWHTQTRFRGWDIDVQVEATAEYPPQRLADITSAALCRIDSHWAGVQRALLDRLHRLYNELWRNPDLDAPLSEREFLDCMILESIDIDDEGVLVLEFADSDLFGDHWIAVRWPLDQPLEVDLRE